MGAERATSTAPVSTQVMMNSSTAYRYVSLATRQFTSQASGRMMLHALKEDDPGGKQKWFNPRDQLQPLIEWAVGLNKQGYNIYMPWALFNATTRKKSAMIASAAFVADFDDGPPKRVDGLTPTLTIETSKGRKQQIFVHQPAALDDVDKTYKRLARTFGCDIGPSGDPVHLWRVPGTMNWLNSKKRATGRKPELTTWDGKQRGLANVLAFKPGVDKPTSSQDNDPGVWPNRRKGKTLTPKIRGWLRQDVHQGGRSEHLHKVVLAMCDLGWGFEDIMDKVRDAPWADRFIDRLAEYVARSVEKFEGDPPNDAAPDEQIDAFEQAAHRLALTDKEESVTYLWKPYLPRKEVTLMEGSSSAGKTSVMLRISKSLIDGEVMPNDARVRGGHHVLYISTESDYTRVTLPKLKRMGLVGNTFWHHQDPTWAIDEDGLIVLDAFMGKHEIDLVVIDNLVDYLVTDGRSQTMNDYSFSSKTLLKMAALAKKHNAAIVAVRHMSKGTKTNVLDRGMGSGGWIKGSRSVLQVDRLEGDEDGQEEYVFNHAKGQFSKRGPKLEYTIASINDKDDVGVATWIGLSEVQDNEIIGKPARDTGGSKRGEAREECKKWLIDKLRGKGPVDVAKIKEEAETRSFTANVLQRASVDAGVKKVVSHDRGKHGVGSTWELVDG